MKRYLFILLTLLLSNLQILHAQSTEQQGADLLIKFNNVVGNKTMKLTDKQYKNNAGEKFSITAFNYFISNIILHQQYGKNYTVPQNDSYFLVQENDPASKNLNIKIPEGKYTSITFTIGVDSLRSTMGIEHRTGALDVSGGMLHGMYWSWNSGYIFMKLEGNCEQAKLDRTGQKKFRYHIGGFGGYNKPSLNNIQTVTINFSAKQVIEASQKDDIILTLQADVLKVFNGPTQISIAQNSSVMFGEFSRLVAENYADMFSCVSTKKQQ